MSANPTCINLRPPEIVQRPAYSKPYARVEVSNGDCEYQPGIAWTGSGGEDDHWLVHSHGCALYHFRDTGDHRAGVAGLAVALLVGWVLIFGAVAHFVTAFKGGGTKQVIGQVLIGLVYLIGGIYFLTHTIMGVATLTLLLGGIFLAEGVIEIVAYFKTRLEGASGWLLFNGIVTLLLAFLILFHWPSSTVWAIGTIVGINLLMTGISRLMFGLAARKLATRIAAA
jgi:uncharacterized membrane protein HdeD (DUF308 family)